VRRKKVHDFQAQTIQNFWVKSFFEALSFFLRYRLPLGYISAMGVGGDWLRRTPLRSGSSLRSE
jgi:hypothetical protein